MKEIEIMVAVTIPHVIVGGKIDKARYTKMPGTVLVVGKDIDEEMAVKYCRGGIAWVPGGTCIDPDPAGRRGYALAKMIPEGDRAELLTDEEMAAIAAIEGKPLATPKQAKQKAVEAE